MSKTLKQMQAEVDEFCREKGWRDQKVSFGEAMALLHSEVSEALEEYRCFGVKLTETRNGKLEGVGMEFADVFIRLLDDCELFGVDIEKERQAVLDYLSRSSETMDLDDSFGENIDGLHILIANVSEGRLDNDADWPLYLASVLVFLEKMAETYGFDLEAEYEEKMKFNRCRLYRHGGKRL